MISYPSTLIENTTLQNPFIDTKYGPYKFDLLLELWECWLSPIVESHNAIFNIESVRQNPVIIRC